MPVIFTEFQIMRLKIYKNCVKLKDIFLLFLTSVLLIWKMCSAKIFDWTDEVRSPTEAKDFSSNLCVQTGSGAHSASHTVGTVGSFPGGKARPGGDADHSPPSNAEVKKE
jgi:hypothetical protein